MQHLVLDGARVLTPQLGRLSAPPVQSWRGMGPLREDWGAARRGRPGRDLATTRRAPRGWGRVALSRVHPQSTLNRSDLISEILLSSPMVNLIPSRPYISNIGLKKYVVTTSICIDSCKFQVYQHVQQKYDTHYVCLYIEKTQYILHTEFLFIF